MCKALDDWEKEVRENAEKVGKEIGKEIGKEEARRTIMYCIRRLKAGCNISELIQEGYDESQVEELIAVLR